MKHDLTLKQEKSKRLVIVDETGEVKAVVADRKIGKLLVDCYNLSSFLFR